MPSTWRRRGEIAAAVVAVVAAGGAGLVVFGWMADDTHVARPGADFGTASRAHVSVLSAEPSQRSVSWRGEARPGSAVAHPRRQTRPVRPAAR